MRWPTRPSTSSIQATSCARIKRGWQLGNASINRLLASNAGLMLVGWGDTFHLETAGRDEPLA